MTANKGTTGRGAAGGEKRKTSAKARDAAAPGTRGRRRRLRVKRHKGPVQLLLPLQMPLALGSEAYAVRQAPPVEDSPHPDDDNGTAALPADAQPGFFD